MEITNRYKFDKSVMRSMTFKEADDHVTHWAAKSKFERLDAACFINNQIFGVLPSDKVDLACSDKRKHP